MESRSDPFLYRATTSIVHILILPSIQCPETLRHKAALRGGFQRPWQTNKKKNGIAHRAWIFSLHKIAFAFLNQTVSRSGLNLASRVTVGQCFTWFSRRPINHRWNMKVIISLSLFAIFRHLVIGTVSQLSVEHRPVRRLSADNRQTHFKLPENERQSASARSMIGRQSADF